MERRRNLPRKARDDAAAAMEEEKAKINGKKKGADPDAENKKRGKPAKTDEKAVNEVAEKAPKKRAPLKSKTDDDIASNRREMPKSRRSKSVEPAPVSKPVKKAAKEPKADASAKKSRATKASSDASEPAPVMTNKRSKKKTSPLPDVAEEEPEVKAQKPKPKITEPKEKAPAKTTKAKKASLPADGSESEVSPKKSKAKANKNLVADPQSEEEEAPIEKSSKSRGKAAKKPAPASGSDEEIKSPVKKPKLKAKTGKAAAPAPASEKEDEAEEDVPAEKPKSKGKAAKKPAPASDSGDEGKSPAKKPKTKAAAGSSKPLMNQTGTDYKNIVFGIKEKFNFKIATWNVAGLRALVKKNPDYVTREDADIVCLNEIKCSEDEIPDEFKTEGYHAYWNVAKGEGGVGILSKVEPIEVSYDIPDTEFADSHRLITAEFEHFILVSVYVVNSGRGLKTLNLRLEWNEKFDQHVQSLDKKKPVIIAGDMNVSHEEIDLANPKGNNKNAGFTVEERSGLTKLLSLGFVDTFRHFYPDETGAYTFWTYFSNARARNVGWRLDYFLVSTRFMKSVKDNVIRSTVMGSDHCPIVLFLNF